MKKLKLVLKIGGSILYNGDGSLSVDIINNYVTTIRKLINLGHSVSIVVGGGLLARNIIKIASQLNIPQAYQDLLGVESSRIHALLFISALGDLAYQFVPRSFDDLRKALSSNRIVVTGGLQPGQSTNAVSSLLAEVWHADLLINLSDVDKVYSSDPHKFPNAKAFDELTISEFAQIISNNTEKPGQYPLFDKVALEIIKRSKIPLIFTYGRKPQNILRITSGEKIGTRIEG